jgi:dipeptidyl aminopeptidase/acylaminoacyl peptidase
LIRRIRFVASNILVLAVGLGAMSDLVAQDKRRIRANDLYRIRTANSLALSPDGERLAFVVTQIDSADNAYYRHIWLADLQSGASRQLTRGRVRDDNPAWSPDGSKLAFVSDRGSNGQQIYILPVDGGEAWPLTELESGASDPAWSPDGTRLLFGSELTTRELEAARAQGESGLTGEGAAADSAMWGSMAAIRNWLNGNAQRQEPAVITRLNFQGERELDPIESWSHIYVVDLEGGPPKRLTDGSFDFYDARFSPDGNRVAFVGRVTDVMHPDYLLKSELYVMNLENGELSKLDVPGHAVSSPSWSPRGRNIAFAARDTAERPSAHTEIGLIALAEGVTSLRWLTRPLDRSVAEYHWSPGGGDIYFTARVHGTVPIYRVRLSDGEIRQVVSGERGVLSFDLGGDRLAYAVNEPANPSEVYVRGPGDDGERRITQLNSDWLSEVHVQPHNGFYFQSFDGRRVQGWLIEPVGSVAGARNPLAVEIHGGPHSMWGPGERSMWHEFQLLAANGYAVLYTNPRGSDGYGFAFKYAIQRNWGDGPMRDVLTAVDSVVLRGIVDEDRMVVTGGSYAGYLTAYLVGHDHRFRAAVAQRGVYDLATFFGEGNAWRLVPYEFNTYPWEDFEILRDQSPLTFAHLIQTPLLIIHSDRDLRTGVSQSEMLYRTLKVLQKPVEYARYPREGHDLSRTGEPRLRIDRLLRILEFFDRHLSSRRVDE